MASDGSPSPPSPLPATRPASPAGGRRRLLLTVGAAVVVFAVAVAVTVGLRRSTEPVGYTDADRATFLDACLAGGGEPMRGTCECTWEGLVAALPPDRYHQLDAAARSVPLTSVVAGSVVSLPPVVPPELEGIVTTCLARHLLLPAAGSTTPSTAPAGSAGPATSIQSSADDPTTTAPVTIELRPDTVPPVPPA